MLCTDVRSPAHSSSQLSSLHLIPRSALAMSAPERQTCAIHSVRYCRSGFVTATASFADGRTKPVRRILVRSLRGTVDVSLDMVLLLGAVQAALCNASASLYGVAPGQPAVGMWLSHDAREGPVALQPTTLLLSANGVVLAYDEVQRSELLDIAAQCCDMGNPEPRHGTPLAVEAATFLPDQSYADVEQVHVLTFQASWPTSGVSRAPISDPVRTLRRAVATPLAAPVASAPAARGVNVSPGGSDAVIRATSLYHEDVAGIPLYSWTAVIRGVTVQAAGTASIVDIRTALVREYPIRYYSKASSMEDTIVVAEAVLADGTTRRVQRVMLGQLWNEALVHGGVHFLGKLLAFLCNARVELFGLPPQPALRTQAQRPVPTMVGLWLSIDPADHTQDALLDLQRATVLFTREGALMAFDAAEYKRLLDVADRRRAIGNTGLPESPMTVEAAKSPPKRLGAEKEVEIFVYDPPLDHPRPAKRTGGFRPFFTRWDAPAGMLDARAAQLLAAAAAHEVRAAAFVAAPPVQPSIVSWC